MADADQLLRNAPRGAELVRLVVARVVDGGDAIPELLGYLRDHLS